MQNKTLWEWQKHYDDLAEDIRQLQVELAFALRRIYSLEAKTRKDVD